MTLNSTDPNDPPRKSRVAWQEQVVLTFGPKNQPARPTQPAQMNWSDLFQLLFPGWQSDLFGPDSSLARVNRLDKVGLVGHFIGRVRQFRLVSQLCRLNSVAEIMVLGRAESGQMERTQRRSMIKQIWLGQNGADRAGRTGLSPGRGG